MDNSIRRIGVLTSGGDSPGMNPCVRAVVRQAHARGVECYGIYEGYAGMIRGEMELLRPRDVSGIIQKGGTILRTARSMEFKTVKGRREAIRQMNERGIDALIIIGGDGSLTGAQKLVDQGTKVVGLPGSIDNDIYGTSMSIGVDTALNTIIHALDSLRDTASSHQRAFLVETMGRSSGYLAVTSGIIGGAELAIIPENPVTVEEVIKEVDDAYLRGKHHCIIVMAEGANIKTSELKKRLDESDVGFKTRITILGHIQRGGSPSAFDRFLATRMGVRAVDALLEGETGVMIGLQKDNLVSVPLDEVISQKRAVKPEYFEMARVLAM